MQISIKLQSLSKNLNIFLDDEKKVFKVDDVDKKINIDMFASKLLRIVSSWKNEYNSLPSVDGLYFEVNVDKDGKQYRFSGQNEFPKNFWEFTSLVRSVENA